MTDEVPRTLMGLLERYSPSGQEAEAADWLVQHMRGLGYEQAFVDQAGNAVGLRGKGPRQLVLLGHIDTVPGEIPLRLEAGQVWARGAVDAKGPLAAFADAAGQVEVPAGWQVVVIGAVGEEADSPGARFVVGQYRPACALIGEPSRWDRVTLGYKGSAWAEVSVSRSRRHTAAREESACEAAAAAWERIRLRARELNLGTERVFDQVQAGLHAMRSEDDGFTERAVLRVGARLPPGMPPADWYAAAAAAAAPAAVTPLGFAIPAYAADKNSALVRALVGGIRAQGGQPGFLLKTGTADLNIVAPAWNCPAAAYGPGDSALDHTPEERLNLQEYARAVLVLRAALPRLMNSPV